MSKPTMEQLIDHFDSNRCWMSDCIYCEAVREALMEKLRVDDDIPPGYFQLNIPIWVLVKMDFFKRLKKMGYEVDMKKTNQYIANSMVDNSEVSRRTYDKEGA